MNKIIAKINKWESIKKYKRYLDTFKPESVLTKYVRISNVKFESYSIPEKKVLLAKDVLFRLELNNIIPVSSLLFRPLIDKDAIHQTQLKNFVNNNTCEVCAKGALFCSYVGRVNKVTVSDWKEQAYTNSVKNTEHQKLLELFTVQELDVIEIAFEGTSYLHASKSEKLNNAAYTFYNNYLNSSQRLEAICNNIIANKGTFLPDKNVF